ncbi:hypothetical protein [Pseudalkalibacillus berkeleyi]|uniref:Membrane bound lipoprotein n=1 Tax=Pseudalkalibacillus berkeleyi TaxID=1069813 RepID=A0ABS9H1F7_9BACL|nr:hypothetical protein [Pseudalkalibacillus berkeleyi]MCF6138774.1 hypothetical protein [Pseudalkalibacillus berkeleyi]
MKGWKWIGLLLFVIAVLTACGTTEETETNEEQASTEMDGQENKMEEPESSQDGETTESKQVESTTTEESEENSSDEESTEEQTNEDVKEPNADAPKPEEQSGSGVYNGQADGHTIEIMFAEGPRAFQITEDVKETINHLKTGSRVTFTYIREGQSLYITSIKEK